MMISYATRIRLEWYVREWLHSDTVLCFVEWIRIQVFGQPMFNIQDALNSGDEMKQLLALNALRVI